MKSIDEIVKEHVLKTQGRMPQTAQEFDDFLDLVNHSKEYAEAVKIESAIGRRIMKKLGFQNVDEIKQSFKDGLRG